MRWTHAISDIRYVFLVLITVYHMVSKSDELWPTCKDILWYYIDGSSFRSHEFHKKNNVINNIDRVNMQLNLDIDLNLFTKINDELFTEIFTILSWWSIWEWGLAKFYIDIVEVTSAIDWKLWWEYYTPSSIVKVIESIVEQENPTQVYDPTMWLWSLLQSIKRVYPKVKLYGQEINAITFLYAKLYSIVSDSLLDTHFVLWDTLYEPQHTNQKFDFIVSNSPVWVKIDYHQIQHRFDIISKSGDIAFVQHALSQLSDKWTYIAVVPNGLLFRWWEEKQYREQLLNSWVIKCVIGFPSGLFASTSIPFSIVIFDRKQQHKQVLMIDATDMFEESKKYQRSLSEYHINTIVEAYNSANDTTWISKFVCIENIISNNSNLLVSYYIDKFTLQFQNITSNFPSYQITTLGDLLISDPVQANGNEEWWVYLLSKGGICATRLYNKDNIVWNSISQDPKVVFKDYLHIVFDTNKIQNNYYSYFVDSEMWATSLDEMHRRSVWTMSRYWFASNIAHLKSLKVIYPNINEQKEIIQAYMNLEKVISSIQQIKKDLAVNPATASQATEKSFQILESLKELTDADKIMDLIRRWEGKNIELKETLHYNGKANKQKDEDLITASLKNIVAFLNTNGWDLLVGVHDHGEIIGIERDLKQYSSIDKFFLYIKDKLKKRVWEQFLQYINYDIIKVNNKDVLWFQCSNSKKECFLDEKSFYIRANPSAEELAWPKLQDYINTHFKNSNYI